jgi:ketosteroid isomerase-like protein
MKRPLVGMMVLALSALTAGCHGYHRQRDTDDMILRAEAVDRRFVQGVNKGDLDMIMETYWNSPDLIVYPPNTMEARGWDATKEVYRGLLAAMPGVQLVIHDARYHVAGDVVLGTGLWSMTIPGSTTPALQGRFSNVIGIKNGQWVYIMDHPSAPLPPPPPSPPAPASQPR